MAQIFRTRQQKTNKRFHVIPSACLKSEEVQKAEKLTPLARYAFSKACVSLPAKAPGKRSRDCQVGADKTSTSWTRQSCGITKEGFRNIEGNVWKQWHQLRPAILLTSITSWIRLPCKRRSFEVVAHFLKHMSHRFCFFFYLHFNHFVYELMLCSSTNL